MKQLEEIAIVVEGFREKTAFCNNYLGIISAELGLEDFFLTESWRKSVADSRL
jgi:hypothetical protein